MFMWIQHVQEGGRHTVGFRDVFAGPFSITHSHSKREGGGDSRDMVKLMN